MSGAKVRSASRTADGPSLPSSAKRCGNVAFQFASLRPVQTPCRMRTSPHHINPPFQYGEELLRGCPAASAHRRKPGKLKVPVESERHRNPVTAHEGEAQAIHKADRLVRKLFKQMERGGFIRSGRTK